MSDSQVRVVVRIRPLLAHEQSKAAAASNATGRGVQACKSPDGAPAILLREEMHEAASAQSSSNNSGGCAETMFTFDGVYEQSSTNTQLFDAEVGPHLGRLFAGSSVTLFAFGMTGTGKSHSMQGSAADPGLIPRSIGALFDSIADRVATGEQEWATTSVNFSFFELYNEKIYDLLKPYTPPATAAQMSDRSSSDSSLRVDPALMGDLPVREDGSGKVFVANLSESKLDSLATFQKLYTKALTNRRVAATKLNAHSSRSHSMALVKIEFRSTKAPHKTIRSRIQMLDLAGNEDNRHSGNTASSKRMLESAKINNSLFVLGKVINALNSGDNRVPYRDSKLTRLLQDSLGGTNYSIMLCNISPNLSHIVWTLRTLQFASKSKQIVNSVSQNVQDAGPTAAELMQQEQEKRADQKAKLEAWRAAQGKAVLSTAAAASAASAAAAAALKAKRVMSAGLLHRPFSAAPSTGDPFAALVGAGAARSGVSVSGLDQIRDPAVIRQINSMAQEAVKQQLALQSKQQQQQLKMLHLRPASAAAAAPAAAAFIPAPSALPLVPLTPGSSASIARHCVQKAAGLERDGLLSQALAEYHEAQRIRPGNEKLAQKIAQLEAKVARKAAAAAASAATAASAGSISPVAAAAALTGAKRVREQVSIPHRSKQARISDASCIEEEDEDAAEEEEEEEDEEEEEEEEDESMSEASGSDYDPDEADTSVDALWATKRHTTRSTRSNPSSAETSPTAPASLKERVEAAVNSRVATPPAAVAAVHKTKAVTPPAVTAAPIVRTPLAPLALKSASSASLAVSKPKSATPPAARSITPKVTPAATAAVTAANKENAVPPSNMLNAKPAAAAALKNTAGVVKPAKVAIAAPLPSLLIAAPDAAAPAATPASAPVPLLLSNFFSGRDNLLRILNSGSLKDLMNLQTIGKKRAQLILAKREEIGSYVTIGDLSAIGLTPTQVEQFTQRNVMSAVCRPAANAANANAEAIEETESQAIMAD